MIGQYFKANHDVDDGFGGTTRACREYTLPCDHQDSEHNAWICGHTRVGPVLQVKVFCCLHRFRIEIQASSTSRDGSNSWIITSRGPNRYIEESYHDPDNSPENREMVNHTKVGRPHAIKSSIE